MEADAFEMLMWEGRSQGLGPFLTPGFQGCLPAAGPVRGPVSSTRGSSIFHRPDRPLAPPCRGIAANPSAANGLSLSKQTCEAPSGRGRTAVPS